MNWTNTVTIAKMVNLYKKRLEMKSAPPLSTASTDGDRLEEMTGGNTVGRIMS